MNNFNHYYIEAAEKRGVLATLRAVVPPRALRFSEALRVAELQANRLLELQAVTDGPVPSSLISDLPRVRLIWRDIPTSGMSYWDGQVWVICLNRAEPATRQRFTLFHEFKHILDHGHTRELYPGEADAGSPAQAEHAADYFAGCALMPKRLLKRAWGEGLQRPAVLAGLFDVSPRAVDVRLAQLGLTEPRIRCAPPDLLRYAPRRTSSYRRPSPSSARRPEGAAA